MGIANANVAKMVVDDINARAACSVVPSSCSSRTAPPTTAWRKPPRRSSSSRSDVDVVLGGIYSSTRQAIKGPVVDQAETLYIYPEQYEGQECHPLIFCTGPVPAQQVEPLFPWLMQQTGAKTFYLPSADYIWPHTMNKKVREVVTAEGGAIVGEEYFPLDHTDYERVVDDIMATGAEVVFNTIVPPGLTPFLEQLHDAGFTKRGGHDRLHLLRRELPEPRAGRARRGPLRLPRLLPRRQRSVQHRAPQPVRGALSRAAPCSPPAVRARACTAA